MNGSSWLDDGGSFNFTFHCSCGCGRRVAIPDARCAYCAAEDKEPEGEQFLQASVRMQMAPPMVMGVDYSIAPPLTMDRLRAMMDEMEETMWLRARAMEREAKKCAQALPVYKTCIIPKETIIKHAKQRLTAPPQAAMRDHLRELLRERASDQTAGERSARWLDIAEQADDPRRRDPFDFRLMSPMWRFR